ncbi:hypothetical protein Rsub_00086 [Raphidocelis subcapitata]|uniref:NAD(P)-binding domain-containing protein n=1 Tax=Raphidocelis subcapitata TaxID=307507 RepID=A0A2V0NRB4_9CHLO|nr:hypothetical protein Rsub_00086 [Raphidocelis subcapitata]|eukprot:GBF87375.1 hypothetical protein Rsub_00086 [Raphidocelis subcapitata]
MWSALRIVQQQGAAPSKLSRATRLVVRPFSADASAAGAPGASAAGSGQAPPSGPPTVVVFGGRGFVGSAVCQEALKQGLEVVSVTPSGTPPLTRAPWVDRVEWVRANALEPRTYQHLLPGAVAAISCVGGFGSTQQMLQVNGAANAAAIAAARAAGVPRFAYVSAHMPPVPGFEQLMEGYVKGKRQAEEELARQYPDGGVALRPWIIYGDRAVSSTIQLPLGLLFGPVEQLLKRVPNARQLADTPLAGALFLPPVSVRAVARAAVAAATDDSVPPGVMNVWDIEKYGDA